MLRPFLFGCALTVAVAAQARADWYFDGYLPCTKGSGYICNPIYPNARQAFEGPMSYDACEILVTQAAILVPKIKSDCIQTTNSPPR